MKEFPWTKTFGATKYGKPSGELMTLAVTDIEPPDITKENWFFMTGTLWRNTHIHNERCAVKCNECKYENK